MRRPFTSQGRPSEMPIPHCQPAILLAAPKYWARGAKTGNDPIVEDPCGSAVPDLDSVPWRRRPSWLEIRQTLTSAQGAPIRSPRGCQHRIEYQPDTNQRRRSRILGSTRGAQPGPAGGQLSSQTGLARVGTRLWKSEHLRLTYGQKGRAHYSHKIVLFSATENASDRRSRVSIGGQCSVVMRDPSLTRMGVHVGS